MAAAAEGGWAAVVLTCRPGGSVPALRRELELRRRRGALGPEPPLVVVLEDPWARLGSGGATLNALLAAAERLSARAGGTVVTSDVLRDARILVLHMGREFSFDDCGRAFTCLPAEDPDAPAEAPVCNLDSLLHTLTHRLCVGSPPGLWVCSTDMLLTVPSAPGIDWAGFQGVRVIAVPGSQAYARNHGVYLADEQGLVHDIIYRGTEAQIRQCAGPDGSVPLVCGVVFFSSDAAEQLLATHVIPPLDACTYMGLDSGAPPIQLSLFFDIVLSMARGVTEEDFVKGGSDASARSARSVLWASLRAFPLSVALLAPRSLHPRCVLRLPDRVGERPHPQPDAPARLRQPPPLLQDSPLPGRPALAPGGRLLGHQQPAGGSRAPGGRQRHPALSPAGSPGDRPRLPPLRPHGELLPSPAGPPPARRRPPGPPRPAAGPVLPRLHAQRPPRRLAEPC